MFSVQRFMKIKYKFKSKPNFICTKRQGLASRFEILIPNILIS